MRANQAVDAAARDSLSGRRRFAASPRPDRHPHGRASFLLILGLYALYRSRALCRAPASTSPIFPTEYVGFGTTATSSTAPTSPMRPGTRSFHAGHGADLLVLGVLVALLLNERFVGNTLLRIGMILPWGVPPTVAGLIWKWIFIDSYGALNAGLYSTGIIDSYMPWLTTPELARMAVVLVFVWSQLPLAAIFLLAAVQAIPDELYDAAASTARTLRPFLECDAARNPADADRRRLFETLMAITNFDIVYSLTQGGPGIATTLLTYFTWVESFKKLDFGKGSALAVLIALGSLVLILVLMRAMPKEALVEEAR